MKTKFALRAATAALILTPLASCGAPQEAAPAVDTAIVASEVQAKVDGLVKAFVERDVAGTNVDLAEDYVGIFHGQPNIVGKEADLEITKLQVADPALGLTVTDQKVDVSEAGDMAVYTSAYAYDFTDEATGNTATEHGNWILLFKRQADGSMKITHGIVSDTPKPAEAAAVQ